MEETIPQTISLLFPVVVAMFIVPLVAWLKNIIPSNLPIRAPAIALVFCGLAMWGLSEWLAPDMSRDTLITYTLGTQVVTQFIDAMVGTAKKLKS